MTILYTEEMPGLCDRIIQTFQDTTFIRLIELKQNEIKCFHLVSILLRACIFNNSLIDYLMSALEEFFFTHQPGEGSA